MIGCNRFEPKNAARRLLFESVRERNCDIGIVGTQDAVQHFMHLARHVAERAPGLWVEHPDVPNAHLKIIREFLIETSGAV